MQTINLPFVFNEDGQLLHTCLETPRLSFDCTMKQSDVCPAFVKCFDASGKIVLIVSRDLNPGPTAGVILPCTAYRRALSKPFSS